MFICMLNRNFSFDIIYRLKWTLDKQTIIWVSGDTLEPYLIQLKRMSASFNGELIFWIDKLDFLKIIKKNYAFEKDWEYFTWVESIDNDTKIKDFTDISLWDFFIRKEEDVTNELLYKFWICWDDYTKKWKVLFENNIIYADSFEFKLEEWKKISELFHLLFIAKVFYNKLYFTYDELKFIFKNWSFKCNELELYDIRKWWIEDIVWKKLTMIKKKTWLKNKILEISTNVVVIWQEKASI